jgi:hypothetical protein
MICIDIQGEEHHCREEQGIVGFLGNPAFSNNQPIKIRIPTNLKDAVTTDALIGRLPICATHATKSRVISRGLCAERASARNPDFRRTQQIAFTNCLPFTRKRSYSFAVFRARDWTSVGRRINLINRSFKTHHTVPLIRPGAQPTPQYVKAPFLQLAHYYTEFCCLLLFVGQHKQHVLFVQTFFSDSKIYLLLNWRYIFLFSFREIKLNSTPR